MPQNGGLIGSRVDPDNFHPTGVYSLEDVAYYEKLGQWSAKDDWERPSEWLTMPDISGQQRFVGLHVVSYDGNFVALSAEGDYTVDWGDGTTTDHASGTVAYKQYNYADIPDTGEATLGYRQVIVSVTPQAGHGLTSLSLQHRHNQPGLNTAYFIGWLDVRLNSSVLTSFNIGGAISNTVQTASVSASSLLTSLASAFQNCQMLRSCSVESTSSVVATNSMFQACSRLREVPFFDTGSVLNMSSMFRDCGQLRAIPHFNTSSVEDFSFIFFNCGQLRKIPPLNTSAATSLQFMFGNCGNLETIPSLNTSNASNFNNTFTNCSSLKRIPLFDMTQATGVGNMFLGCNRLEELPHFSFPNLQHSTGMFLGCSKVTKLPAFDTSGIITMQAMFQGMGIRELPLLDLSNVTYMQDTFAGCAFLEELPPLDLSNVQNLQGTFQGCSQLKKVPLLDTSNATNMALFLANCHSLEYVPALDAGGALLFRTAIASGGNLARCDVIGIDNTTTFLNCKLSSAELQRIFGNLASVSGQTITITGNYGATTTVSKTSCGTTAGSVTITVSDTSGLAVGMRVTGVGFDAAAAVTMQDSGDTVTRVSHGVANGTQVSFASIVTTTGIQTNTIYYVINATTDTFQLSASEGGAAIALTGDGSGTLRIPAYVVSISDNVSVDVSSPAKSTGTATLAFRLLDTFAAIAKGWTVSG